MDEAPGEPAENREEVKVPDKGLPEDWEGDLEEEQMKAEIRHHGQEPAPRNWERERSRNDTVSVPDKGLPADYEESILQEELDTAVGQQNRGKAHKLPDTLPGEGLPSNWESELRDSEIEHSSSQEKIRHKQEDIPATGLPDNLDSALDDMEMTMGLDNKKADRKEKGDAKWGKDPNKKKPFFDLSKIELNPAIKDAIGSLKTPSGRKKAATMVASEINTANINVGKGAVAVGATSKPTGVAYTPAYLIGFQGYNTFRAPVWGEKTRGNKGRKGSYKRALAPQDVMPRWVFGQGMPWDKTTQRKPAKSHHTTQQHRPSAPPLIAMIEKKPGWLAY